MENDEYPYPERLAAATEAYMARCREPYIFGASQAQNEPYFAHARAREEAIDREYRNWNRGPDWQRLPCCAAIVRGRMGGGRMQIHAHVAGLRHVAAVFGVDEAALRAEVRAWKQRGEPEEEPC